MLALGVLICEEPFLEQFAVFEGRIDRLMWALFLDAYLYESR